MKYLRLEINNLVIQFVAAKIKHFYLKNLSSASSKSLYNYFFDSFFIKIFILYYNIYIYFACGFLEVSKYLAPKVIVQSYLKRLVDF